MRIPAASRWAVTEGGEPAAAAAGRRFVRWPTTSRCFEVGSGSYAFAVDAALGHIGDARETAAALTRRVAGELSGSDRARAAAAAREIERRLASAWAARAAGADAVGDVHRALAALAELRAVPGAGRLAPTPDTLDRRLSAASAALLGATAELAPASAEALPGDTLGVRVVLANGGDRTLAGVRSALTAPAGWTVAAAGEHPETVAPGASAAHPYELSVPADAAPGPRALAGTIAYTLEGGTATLPVAATVDVRPAVTLTALEAAPATAAPGAAVTVRATVHNRSRIERSGTVTVAPPAGWEAPAAAPYALAPGAEATVELPLRVPLSVTAGTAELTASVEGERRTTELQVAFGPPDGALDRVDLGDAASEQAHGLTASPASGTNVEAGLTRRYTNSAQPGGWFEFDLQVPAGVPFVLRAIETYDQPQRKTYDVLVDGAVVHARDHRRAASGTGSLAFQFVVEPSAATADGRVRVRFQDTGADYDPSIADVWSLPLP